MIKVTLKSSIYFIDYIDIKVASLFNYVLHGLLFTLNNEAV